jgi:hypothetical protein
VIGSLHPVVASMASARGAATSPVCVDREN